MIDVSQWRCSIGLWCCHKIPYITKNATNGINTLGWVESLYIWLRGPRDEGHVHMTLSVVLFLLLLLILSGDIELNPGPKTGKQL